MNTCRKIKSLGLAGALLVGTTVHGATRYWVVGDGNWDFTTTNWHTSAGGGPTVTYTDGDAAYFSSATPNRNRWNEIVISVPAVAPSFLQAEGGYGCRFSFSGGDITGGCPVNIRGQNAIRFRRSMSHTGLVTVCFNNADIGTFEFKPDTRDTLTSRIHCQFQSELGGNTNADWSGATVTASGKVNIPAMPDLASHYTGLILRPTGASLELAIVSHYNANSRGTFNGRVVGPNTWVVLTGANSSTYRNFITGPGNWDIAGLIKTNLFTAYIYADNFCGRALKIEQGKLWLGTGTVQNVRELWLGGEPQTNYGTYGSTSSPADFKINTWFEGAGVIRLLKPTTGTVMMLR